jgi:hypothetical protein
LLSAVGPRFFVIYLMLAPPPPISLGVMIGAP